MRTFWEILKAIIGLFFAPFIWLARIVSPPRSQQTEEKAAEAEKSAVLAATEDELRRQNLKFLGLPDPGNDNDHERKVKRVAGRLFRGEPCTSSKLSAEVMEALVDLEEEDRSYLKRQVECDAHDRQRFVAGIHTGQAMAGSAALGAVRPRTELEAALTDDEMFNCYRPAGCPRR